MPSNQSPLGALPSRFRRQRILIIGCGDVGLRVVRQLPPRVRVLALTSSPEKVPAFRRHDITPLAGDLDQPATLRRLAGLATRVIHLAPPLGDNLPDWRRDPRTQALLRALRLRGLPQSMMYGSTSGVYGNCDGELATEVRAVNPHTPRAQRRVDAEQQLRFFGRSSGVVVHTLRIPGIYAPDREGGTPRSRLLKGTPVLQQVDDVYTNHIHADDLARACLAALWRGKPQRITNASDDTELKMGDYFDLAADLYGLPRPPRVARNSAQDELPLMLLSFMRESRRLDNTRLKQELRLRLHYPTVRQGLVAPAAP
ncbi:MAG: SDR family oxidoreductase [Pseudomonadota bacterium]|uniref:SDR family oxidoreductase n=1 Tax=Polaromonas sp. TaxID=1869339 RepID=UPI0017911929|nr:SDR family oxidoreductase [Polaromonas sp.]MBA3595529.1 SDR family oxidoreductase [Polaromonas sp.]MDQ3271650.1 SDR family oxidoreductase [Pseudomonadota bacterium]